MEEHISENEMHQINTLKPTDDTEKGNINEKTPIIDVYAIVIENQHVEDVQKDFLSLKKWCTGYTRLDKFEQATISIYVNN